MDVVKGGVNITPNCKDSYEIGWGVAHFLPINKATKRGLGSTLL